MSVLEFVKVSSEIFLSNIDIEKKAFSTTSKFDIIIMKSDQFYLESMEEILDNWKEGSFWYVNLD